ncbi:MAG: hypothetical protein R2746_00895 [Acidimicrobiales bacterium]
MTSRSTSLDDEHGFAGGIEVLPFAVLVFVLGTLLIANAWAVVDAKLAVESSAREAARTYVEAGSAARGEADALASARRAFEASGRDPRDLRVHVVVQEYVRCAPVEVEVTYEVRAVRLPVIKGLGHDFSVTGRHREIIDPFAAGFGEENRCGF